MRWPWQARRELDVLAADADRRAGEAREAAAEVERSRHRVMAVASTSERLADANRIAAMIRDGLLAGRDRYNGTGEGAR